jgi:hypothetical protein
MHRSPSACRRSSTNTRRRGARPAALQLGVAHVDGVPCDVDGPQLPRTRDHTRSVLDTARCPSSRASVERLVAVIADVEADRARAGSGFVELGGGFWKIGRHDVSAPSVALHVARVGAVSDRDRCAACARSRDLRAATSCHRAHHHRHEQRTRQATRSTGHDTRIAAAVPRCPRANGRRSRT